MLRIIFYLVVGILILSFFGISIQSIIHSPTGQENFGFVGNLLAAGFNFIVDFFVSIINWFRHLIP